MVAFFLSSVPFEIRMTQPNDTLRLPSFNNLLLFELILSCIKREPVCLFPSTICCFFASYFSTLSGQACFAFRWLLNSLACVLCFSLPLKKWRIWAVSYGCFFFFTKEHLANFCLILGAKNVNSKIHNWWAVAHSLRLYSLLDLH